MSLLCVSAQGAELLGADIRSPRTNTAASNARWNGGFTSGGFHVPRRSAANAGQQQRAVRRPTSCQFVLSVRKEINGLTRCPDPDFRSPRLLSMLRGVQTGIALDRDQSNYLGNVLRPGAGRHRAGIQRRDGEWQATLAGRKRPDRADIIGQTSPAGFPTQVRAATCAARLHGTEGRRNGRCRAAPDNASYSRRASRRAHAPSRPRNSAYP